jgi:hypothetical protein
VIPRRRKTGTFTKSKITAKLAAAADVPATMEAGRGVIRIPPMANVDAIRRSAIVENTT